MCHVFVSSLKLIHGCILSPISQKHHQFNVVKKWNHLPDDETQHTFDKKNEILAVKCWSTSTSSSHQQI
jgi:hypothetical protein